MIDRIKYNWTFTRALYLGMGLLIIVQSAMTTEITGIIFGAYFASMGLFGVGCASGNCYVPPSASPKNQSPSTEDVSYEEIKS